MLRRRCLPLLLLFCLAACVSAPAPGPTPTPTANPANINLDSATQALIASAGRVAFIVPFSHWDTDWHDSYANYAKRSDGNILSAIQLAQQDPRYRYAFEQVLFVQHFWDNHPDQRQTLKHFVQTHQFTFAWAGITQPETSLVAPAIQVRNLQLGRQWIADTFGPEYISSTGWQSDAFGNSAALPSFLAANDIPNLFIGRWQHRCDPDFQDCQPLPEAFYWQSPAATAKILVSYSSYPSAWDAIHRLPSEAEQVKALNTYIDQQFARTTSKYVFIPMGSDFIDPIPNLMALVDSANSAATATKLVIADPATAFQYLATQNLPTLTVDLNPIWQAFYATRPFAKIADKESDYYLTAADKFAEIARQNSTAFTPDPALALGWNLAAINTHYDNISGVSFDGVWNSSQQPRFEQALKSGSDALTVTLAGIASGIGQPLAVFNPSSWERSEVIEVQVPAGLTGLPAGQDLGADTRAILVKAVSSLGWTARPSDLDTTSAHAASVTEANNLVTLSNSLVSVTLDPVKGGTLTQMPIAGNPGLISAPSDDLTFWEDTGDVYGATFKSLIARESDSPAKIEILASGPLLARVKVTFALASQPITKVITLRADSTLIEVELSFAVNPNTAGVIQTHTDLKTANRNDDSGFATLIHAVDNTALAAGDRTYRREIFYPITYFSDVTDGGSGLALITHGLQGLGGVGDLNLLLTRDARQDQEGVTDTETHTFHYAYLPHAAPVAHLPQLAYAFNQPLIPVVKTPSQVTVELPFTTTRQLTSVATNTYPEKYSFLSTSGSALVLDLYRVGDQLNAVVLNYQPDQAANLSLGSQTLNLAQVPLAVLPLHPK